VKQVNFSVNHQAHRSGAHAFRPAPNCTAAARGQQQFPREAENPGGVSWISWISWISWDMKRVCFKGKPIHICTHN